MPRALVVDDDPDLADLVVMSLEMAGMDVLTARTGREAVEIAGANALDLVTLDMTLPDMDGAETCRRLRQVTTARILMVTGRTDLLDELVGPEVGADDALAKPFLPRELRERALALLDRAQPDGQPAGGAD